MLLPLLLSLATNPTGVLKCGLQDGNRLFTATVSREDDGVLTLTTASCTLVNGTCGPDMETDRYFPVTKTTNGGYAGTGVSLLPLFEGGFRLSGDEGTVMDFPARSCR